MSPKPLLDSELGREALARLCEAEALQPEIAQRLVEVVRAQAGRLRRRGLFDDFDEVLADDG